MSYRRFRHTTQKTKSQKYQTRKPPQTAHKPQRNTQQPKTPSGYDYLNKHITIYYMKNRYFANNTEYDNSNIFLTPSSCVCLCQKLHWVNRNRIIYPLPERILCQGHNNKIHVHETPIQIPACVVGCVDLYAHQSSVRVHGVRGAYIISTNCHHRFAHTQQNRKKKTFRIALRRVYL